MVNENELGAAVFQDVLDLMGFQAGIDRATHCSRSKDTLKGI
jgi:hypothetical protein